MMIRNKLRIVTWNANGIVAKLPTFEVFLNSNDIDICLLTETHLTSNNNFYIDNYQVYDAICLGEIALLL